MTPESRLRRSRLLAAGLSLLLLSLNAGAAPADESGLPDTLRRGYVEPIVGPVDDEAYAHGQLGLIRPGYGRASLYVAWRIMHLPVGAVAAESHDRLGSWLNGRDTPSTEGEIDEWLRLRGALVATPPAVTPDYFRTSKKRLGDFEFDMVTGNCGAASFRLATQLLRDLIADKSLKDADRRAWIAGQDAVFARCSALPPALPPLPRALSAKVHKKVRDLGAYQQAAALFYGDEFGPARQAFEAIAATPDHPLRAWATLGAIRCIVRDAATDPEWEAAFKDAFDVRQLRGEALAAAVAGPRERHQARVRAAMTELNERAGRAVNDASLAEVHGAIRYTVRRAASQFLPVVPLRDAMEALDHVDRNPYTMGALDLFQAHYPRVAPDYPTGELATALRQHAWFDFIVTVQACAEGMEAALCAGEHQHALAQWQATKDNAWLLAALMTARQPTAADLAAAEAARTVAADRPEWASLQFYAARVWQGLGRAKPARAALDAVLASSQVSKRDLAVVKAARAAL